MLASLPSLAEIAAAKAEIFDGLCGLGVAVLNRDDEFFDELSRRARLAGANRIIGFGTGNDSNSCLLSSTATKNGQKIEADCAGIPLSFSLGMTAPHWALNTIGILAVIETLGLDVAEAATHLADFFPICQGAARSIMASSTSSRLHLLMTAIMQVRPRWRLRSPGLPNHTTNHGSLCMLELGDGTGTAHDALVPLLTPLVPRVIMWPGNGPHDNGIWQRPVRQWPVTLSMTASSNQSACQSRSGK